jgi:hypothetical protein
VVADSSVDNALAVGMDAALEKKEVEKEVDAPNKRLVV